MKLYFAKETLVFQKEQTINAPVEKVWQLLTTTEGLAKWFPELNAENLADGNALTFEADGFKADMDVLAYDSPTYFKLMWDSGEVSFHLKENTPQETTLDFLEILPISFPNLYQDIAGWHYELKRLKGVAEGKEVIFTADCIRQKAEEMRLMMKEQPKLDK